MSNTDERRRAPEREPGVLPGTPHEPERGRFCGMVEGIVASARSSSAPSSPPTAATSFSTTDAADTRFSPMAA